MIDLEYFGDFLLKVTPGENGKIITTGIFGKIFAVP